VRRERENEMTTIEPTGRRARPARRVWAAALFVLGVLLPAATRADTLTTTDGKVFEGKIVERTDEGVHFEVVSGTMRGKIFFPNSRIAKLEIGLSPDEKRRQAYEARKKSLDLTTAAGWHQLGLWCAGETMYDWAIQAFRQSIALDRAYLGRSTLAQARMEVGRGRLRTARQLLASLVKARPDDAAAKAELARVQQRLDAELRGLFDRGRAAYRRGDHATALGLFRRVAGEADATVLADLARTLARNNEPSLAEMLVTCRLSDALVRRSTTFETVTALERPFLMTRLQALLEAGVRASTAAYGAIAAKPAAERSERLAAAQAELKALTRLDVLARVGRGLAGELKNEQAAARFEALIGDLTNARARITLLWAGTLEAAAEEALRTLTREGVSFDKRVKAADAAADYVRDGLSALKKLAAKTAGLPDATAAGLLAQRRRLQELDRRVRAERTHIKRIETALDRSLRAYDRRQYDDAIRWFERLIKEASAEEGRAIERLVKRRTGEDLVDLMVAARIRQARRARRFRDVTRYEREALDRELSRRASRAAVRAADALRDARDAEPGSTERRNAARNAISRANEAIFYLRGRRDVGADLSRRERRQIDHDIDDMNDVSRNARRLLSTD